MDQARNAFIASSPKWLIALTAMQITLTDRRCGSAKKMMKALLLQSTDQLLVTCP